MGNWEKEQEAKREQKERTKVSKEALGKYFYDVSKLILAGVVIGGFTPILSDKDADINILSVLIGSITAIFCAWIGNRILKQY